MSGERFRYIAGHSGESAANNYARDAWKPLKKAEGGLIADEKALKQTLDSIESLTCLLSFT